MTDETPDAGELARHLVSRMEHLTPSGDMFVALLVERRNQIAAALQRLPSPRPPDPGADRMNTIDIVFLLGLGFIIGTSLMGLVWTFYSIMRKP